MIIKFSDFILLEKHYEYGDPLLYSIELEQGDSYTDSNGETHIVEVDSDTISEYDIDDKYLDIWIEEIKNEEIEKFKKATFEDDFIKKIKNYSKKLDDLDYGHLGPDDVLDKKLYKTEGIKELIVKLRLFSNPTLLSNKGINKIDEMQSKLTIFTLLEEFQKCISVAKKPVRGFNFESFIAGIVSEFGVVSDEKSSADLIDSLNNTYQLKFYSIDSVPISKKKSLVVSQLKNINKSTTEKELIKIIEYLISEILLCDYYIIAFSDNVNVKLFIIDREELIEEFYIFITKTLINISKAENNKDLIKIFNKRFPLMKKYTSDISDTIIIGNGVRLSKSGILRKYDKKSININIGNIEESRNNIISDIGKTIDSFDEEIISLKDNFDKMKLGIKSSDSKEKTSSGLYKENYEKTYTSIEKLKKKLNILSYGRLRNVLSKQ
jgi:hypothetical protein